MGSLNGTVLNDRIISTSSQLSATGSDFIAHALLGCRWWTWAA